MKKLNEAIKNIGYIFDCLIAYRNIIKTGDCNVCGNRDCGYMPRFGEEVRYNCPFYRPKEGTE